MYAFNTKVITEYHMLNFIAKELQLYKTFNITRVLFFGRIQCIRCIMLAVWLRGNALASINVVALRQTRLVLGDG